MSIELTEKEQKAIDLLHKAARIWPKSLWLFSGAGSLCVMKKKNGKPVYTNDLGRGVDPDYVVDVIEIENDGGDWD